MAISNVLLEFRPSPDEIASIRAVKHTKAGKRRQPRSLIDRPRSLYFGDQGLLNLPLRFRIGNCDLLGSNDNPWLAVPLAVFPAGWISIHKAAAHGRSTIRFDLNALHFRVEEDLVLVQSNSIRYVKVGDGSGEVEEHGEPPYRDGVIPLLDLVSSWGSITDKVRNYLLSELPELVAQEDYGPWLREGREALLRNINLPQILAEP